MTFSVSCAAGTLHINIAITHVIIVLGTVESHMPYMPSEYIRRIGTKNSGTCTHFKFGAGLGSPLPHVAINNQYLFHNQTLLYLAFHTIDISQSG